MWQPNRSDPITSPILQNLSRTHTPLTSLPPAPGVPPTPTCECHPSHCWCHVSLDQHTAWRGYRFCTALYEVTCWRPTPSCSESPHDWYTTWNYSQAQQPFHSWISTCSKWWAQLWERKLPHHMPTFSWVTTKKLSGKPSFAQSPSKKGS